MRLHMSRDRLSVPSQCAAEGGGSESALLGGRRANLPSTRSVSTPPTQKRALASAAFAGATRCGISTRVLTLPPPADPNNAVDCPAYYRDSSAGFAGAIDPPPGHCG